MQGQGLSPESVLFRGVAVKIWNFGVKFSLLLPHHDLESICFNLPFDFTNFEDNLQGRNFSQEESHSNFMKTALFGGGGGWGPFLKN